MQQKNPKKKKKKKKVKKKKNNINNTNTEHQQLVLTKPLMKLPYNPINQSEYNSIRQ
jgi:hypothetical protein